MRLFYPVPRLGRLARVQQHELEVALRFDDRPGYRDNADEEREMPDVHIAGLLRDFVVYEAAHLHREPH